MDRLDKEDVELAVREGVCEAIRIMGMEDKATMQILVGKGIRQDIETLHQFGVGIFVSIWAAVIIIGGILIWKL